MYACYFSVINIIIIIHRNPAPCILSTSSSSATPSVYFSSSFSHTTMQVWQAQFIISSTTLDAESVTLKILTPSWRRKKHNPCQRWRPNLEFPKLREAGRCSGKSSWEDRKSQLWKWKETQCFFTLQGKERRTQGLKLVQNHTQRAPVAQLVSAWYLHKITHRQGSGMVGSGTGRGFKGKQSGCTPPFKCGTSFAEICFT